MTDTYMAIPSGGNVVNFWAPSINDVSAFRTSQPSSDLTGPPAMKRVGPCS